MKTQLLKKHNLIIALILFYTISISAQEVSTLAGSYGGFLDDIGTAAQLSHPTGICYDGLGNIYVADENNNRIRKVEIATGAVTTLAGSTAGYADGTGTSALFSSPYGICTDGIGNLYVVDIDNWSVRKIEIATGVVTTLAGGTTNAPYADGIGIAATFSNPTGICSDGLGNLYVADSGNQRIRKIEIATATVTSLAGYYDSGFSDGVGTSARFNSPFGICYDGVGNLYVADRANKKIRKIEIATATVTTLAGSSSGYTDGIGLAAKFSNPAFICYDGVGNLYVSDTQNYKIRKIEIATATVSTLAGSISGFLDGPANTAQFASPNGICTDTSGNLYVTDNYPNHKIRKVTDAFLGINQSYISEIKIHPNPVSSSLTIEAPFTGNLQLKVINNLGQIVIEQNQNTSLISLDVSNLSKGLYFLNITTEDGSSQTIKFIKN